MTKVRGFSIVFHNVMPAAKPKVEQFIAKRKPTRSVVACEPYPEQEGFHIHLFCQFSCQQSFQRMLNDCLDLAKTPGFNAERPEGETRCWGRVEVEQLFAKDWEDCTGYLTNPKKDKPLDPEVRSATKFDRTCDICGVVFDHRFGDSYDYPDCKSGRCWKCRCIPDRMLKKFGFDSVPSNGF